MNTIFVDNNKDVVHCTVQYLPYILRIGSVKQSEIINSLKISLYLEIPTIWHKLSFTLNINIPWGIKKAPTQPITRTRYLMPQQPFCKPALGSRDVLTPIISRAIIMKNRVTTKQILSGLKFQVLIYELKN